MPDITQVVSVINALATSPVVLVCEHASSAIPSEFNDLGLSGSALQSHIAWDPGALTLATHLSRRLDAKLVTGNVSRLVYDCNRPPAAPDAMPAKSETIDVPGNANLDAAARMARADAYYTPFHTTLADAVAATKNPVIVTIHSFTPVFHGKMRDVEIGVLHDSDARFADAILHIAKNDESDLNILRNEPYGPADGVTHTLKKHGIANGYPNVMLEVRNDLLATDAQQTDMATLLCRWLTTALVQMGAKEVSQ